MLALSGANDVKNGHDGKMIVNNVHTNEER